MFALIFQMPKKSQKPYWILLVKGKLDQNMWSLRLFFLTHCHMTAFCVILCLPYLGFKKVIRCIIRLRKVPLKSAHFAVGGHPLMNKSF